MNNARRIISLALLFAGAAFAQCPSGFTLSGGQCVSGAITSFVPGAQAIYLFNEGSGSVFRDTSGNGRDCTVDSAFTWLPVQGVTTLTGSQASCPAAAFNNAGTIQIWVKPSYMPQTRTFLYSTSSAQFVLQFDPASHSFIGFSTNKSINQMDGYMSSAFVMTPWTSYVNGKPSFGAVEVASNQTLSATAAVWIGCGCGAFLGDIYGIAAYPTGLTPAQISQNDAAMWGLLKVKGIIPRDVDTSKSAQLYLGDSITANNKNTGTYETSIPYLTDALRKYSGLSYNLGQSGQTAGQIIANFTPAYGNLLSTYTFGVPTVNLMAGVNDVSGGGAAAAIYANLNQACANVVAANAAAKCLLSTITPESVWSGAQQTVRTTLNSTIYSNWLSGAISAHGVIDIANDPIMGNQNLATNTTWFQADGIHPTTAGNGLISRRYAFTQCLLTNQPCQLIVTVPYQYFTAGAIAATTATVNLLQLGPRQKICGVTQRVTTPFAGTLITAITGSVGDSGGTATQYASALSWFTSTTQDQASTFVSANGIVQATVTATGANLSALTAGSADVSLCVVQQ